MGLGVGTCGPTPLEVTHTVHRGSRCAEKQKWRLECRHSEVATHLLGVGPYPAPLPRGWAATQHLSSKSPFLCNVNPVLASKRVFTKKRLSS